MTCVIGMVHDGKVYMGCDSASSDGYYLRATKLSKVFIQGQFIIGYTSSFRMGQIIQYMPMPETVDCDPLEFMVTRFVPAIRTALKEGGYTTVDNNKETGGTFLVGLKGQLFSVECDFQVNQMVDGFDAVGIGKAFALGAVQARMPTTEPEKIIRVALEIASHFADGVIGPYYVKVLE